MRKQSNSDNISFLEEIILKAIQRTMDVTEQDKRRVSLAVSFYRLLNQKYNFDNIEFGQ